MAVQPFADKPVINALCILVHFVISVIVRKFLHLSSRHPEELILDVPLFALVFNITETGLVAFTLKKRIDYRVRYKFTPFFMFSVWCDVFIRPVLPVTRHKASCREQCYNTFKIVCVDTMSMTITVSGCK